MPALNFKKQFVPDLESGKKTYTIRPVHKTRPIVVGDTLMLYTGMRTKNCRKIKDVVCSLVGEIFIDEGHGLPVVRSNNGTLAQFEINLLAQQDGFADGKELIAFFKKQYRLPFIGVLIGWENESTTKPQRSQR